MSEPDPSSRPDPALRGRRGRLGLFIAVSLLAAGAVLSVLYGAGSGRDMSSRSSSTALPALAVETGDGRPLSLSDFQGRFVLLNVWATWCPPCRKEMPSLDRLQAKIGGDDFEVVALSIDRQGAELVKPFFASVGVARLVVYLDRTGSVMPALRIAGLPTTVLIDPRGVEVARWVGAKEWDEPAVIDELRTLMRTSRS
jgi:thiol-disulfide isomerase/thioredoxin